LGSGQTGKSTAHVTSVLDERFINLEKIHGEKGVRLAVESHIAAIKKIKEIIRNEKIDCDSENVSGYLVRASGEHDINLNDELEVMLRVGLSDVYMTEVISPKLFSDEPAIRIPDQLEINPLKYIKGLALGIIQNGGEIYTNSPVIEMIGGDDAYVKVQNTSRVKCGSIIVATNAPINDLLVIHTKQVSYITYVIGFEVTKNTINHGLYWDTATPYHYIRIVKNDDLPYEVLLVGGEDHKTGQNGEPENSYTRLEAWARKKFPQIGKINFHWSGQIIKPVDGLSFIGHNPLDADNVYIATGFSGNGITYSAIAGMLLTDLIMKKDNPWSTLYNPSRISLLTIGSYIKDNTTVAVQYEDLFTFKPGNMQELESDNGGVFRDGLKNIAAFKDQYGNIDVYSASCPHLGGVVRWNKAEKSWDCPCHGSRFDNYGKVMCGPAISNLKFIKSISAEQEQNYPWEVL
jgi:glycine/D-amino acid oxidase-like deaminating enzyme/nitrite reductase/ring-hydroxylating ferredoxin subunit